MTPGHLAEQSDANDKERYRRCPIYSENPSVVERDRKLIRGLLGHKTTTASGWKPKAIPLEDLTDAFFYKSATADTISLVIPVSGIHISRSTRTAAFLYRRSPFPVVSSLSGRSGPHEEEFLEPGDSFERLNPRFWMPQTIRFASEFGFAFESHDNDAPATPGSYYAGHDEAMFICFLVQWNYLFRDCNRYVVHIVKKTVWARVLTGATKAAKPANWKHPGNAVKRLIPHAANVGKDSPGFNLSYYRKTFFILDKQTQFDLYMAGLAPKMTKREVDKLRSSGFGISRQYKRETVMYDVHISPSGYEAPLKDIVAEAKAAKLRAAAAAKKQAANPDALPAHPTPAKYTKLQAQTKPTKPQQQEAQA
ncbi:hypothetical protein N657DRAFT_693379 [Parathielavia appendiculata]|uniref:Uncharacterized protein n=1 Tax=Parathielavia appendiculata TaxID=2587402 RepID=A0AAN6YZH5_9PEZI|nr:hypothetical protein N657DRAFT_693379 [Parathielavia appendiculata]